MGSYKEHQLRKSIKTRSFFSTHCRLGPELPGRLASGDKINTSVSMEYTAVLFKDLYCDKSLNLTSQIKSFASVGLG